MTLLILAALVWLAIHIGLSGTALRAAIVARTGEKAFSGAFSALALLALLLLILAYRGADTTVLWYAPPWLVLVVDALVLAAVLLLVMSLFPPRGTGTGPRGVLRITRHPLMSAAGLWAAAHMIANGDIASLVFFGAFLGTVLAGLPSIDAKLARRQPDTAAALHPVTSRVPFGAIVAGRNRLVLAEIGWLPPVVGALVWVALLHLHPLVIGVPALPVW